MSRVAITGAAGFLGRALVQGARAQGRDVLALIRSAPHPDWAEDTGITSVAVDLGDPESADRLGPLLGDVTAVIHAAASFGGDAAAHARDTIDATAHLVKAANTVAHPPRFVLISSLSVYDVAAMSDNAVLDEQSPLLYDTSQRDAYAAAKRAQERLVQETLSDFFIMRPGALYGPGRLWSAQLGFAKAGIVVCPGGTAAVPAIHVNHAVSGILAALRPDVQYQISNLIDANPPSQTDWLRALGQRHIAVPLGIVLTAGGLLGRGTAWSARFRPLRYDTTLSEQFLRQQSAPSFREMMTKTRRDEQEPS